MKQTIVTLDMEGVLTPEIWIAVAEKTGIEALRRTTRDEPDYDKLMRSRLEILDQHGPCPGPETFWIACARKPSC
jgi:phosphoserine/homoserine phosphotransferase